MTFLEFLNEAAQNIKTTNAGINLQLANEDDKDKAKLSKFVVALKKNGIVLGDLKDDTFNKIEFTAKKFDYEAFINSLKGVYNDFEQEVAVNGSFIYDDKKYNIEVDIPTGMIDVLPTIGNMLGIHSDYQIGHDIFSLKDKDNTVVFVDGSFLTSKVYYNAPKAEIYDIIKEGVGEEYIKERADYATEIIEVSNDIISYNLIKELKSGINKSN